MRLATYTIYAIFILTTLQCYKSNTHIIEQNITLSNYYSNVIKTNVFLDVYLNNYKEFTLNRPEEVGALEIDQGELAIALSFENGIVNVSICRPSYEYLDVYKYYKTDIEEWITIKAIEYQNHIDSKQLSNIDLSFIDWLKTDIMINSYAIYISIMADQINRPINGSDINLNYILNGMWNTLGLKINQINTGRLEIAYTYYSNDNNLQISYNYDGIIVEESEQYIDSGRLIGSQSTILTGAVTF